MHHSGSVFSADYEFAINFALGSHPGNFDPWKFYKALRERRISFRMKAYLVNNLSPIHGSRFINMAIAPQNHFGFVGAVN